MRIIGGAHRSRRLAAPEGLATRPMTDRVRENLFNLLGQDLTGAVVLDLFCGSGALGLEALSRGAAFCRFVDASPDAIQAVRTNCRELGLEAPSRISREDVLRPGPWIRPPAGAWYTHVFIDPPYRMTAEADGRSRLARMAEALGRMGCLAEGAMVMLRAKRGTAIALPWSGFRTADERSYGTTTLHLMTYGGIAETRGDP